MLDFIEAQQTSNAWTANSTRTYLFCRLNFCSFLRTNYFASFYDRTETNISKFKIDCVKEKALNMCDSVKRWAKGMTKEANAETEKSMILSFRTF